MTFKLKFCNLLVGVLLLSGCKDSKVIESDEVLLTYHKRFEEDIIDSVKIVNEIYKDSINHIFIEGKDTLDIGYTSYKRTSAYINMYFEEKCPIVSRKIFKMKGGEFEVKKYYYDLEGVSDENTSFFICDQYGLLVVYNNGWRKLVYTLSYDETSKILIDKIVNDPTGFYDKVSPALKK